MRPRVHEAARAHPIPVDFDKNAWDRAVRDLAKEGLYGSTIWRNVPALSQGQVYYRIRAAGYGGAYRKGETPESRDKIDRILGLLEKARHLRHDPSELVGVRRKQARRGRGN